jgi:hypothetical protein
VGDDQHPGSFDPCFLESFHRSGLVLLHRQDTPLEETRVQLSVGRDDDIVKRQLIQLLDDILADAAVPVDDDVVLQTLHQLLLGLPLARSPFMNAPTVAWSIDAPAPTKTIIMKIRRMASVGLIVVKFPPFGT